MVVYEIASATMSMMCADQSNETESMGTSDLVPMSAYDYGLPDAAIAQEPVEPRSSARMLVSGRVSNSGMVEHASMVDLPALLRAGDVVVVNDTRVLAARLELEKVTGGEAEVLLLEPTDPARSTWEALVRPGRRLPPGTVLHEANQGQPVVEIGRRLAAGDDSRRSVRLIDPTVIERSGSMPLPPYIHQRLADPERYQTVYARTSGSAAAPTAGLHFTQGMLEELRAADVSVAELTLHVGPGTFRPVKEHDILKHVMHREFYEMTPDCAARINRARQDGHRVIAVGTTSCRVIETVASEDGQVQPGTGWTDIFIYPGYRFKAIDALLTNFHLPESTLIMLVSAFAGRENILSAYHEAIENHYRFFSFGDAMLIMRTAYER